MFRRRKQVINETQTEQIVSSNTSEVLIKNASGRVNEETQLNLDIEKKQENTIEHYKEEEVLSENINLENVDKSNDVLNKEAQKMSLYSANTAHLEEDSQNFSNKQSAKENETQKNFYITEENNEQSYSERLENKQEEILILQEDDNKENSFVFVEHKDQPFDHPINYKEEKQLYGNSGIAQKTFHALSYIALPILILLTIALSFQQLVFPRDFWISEEVRFADVYMNMLATGNFFHLTLNGLPFAEAGPLYFLSIYAINSIPGVAMPQAFFIASTIFASLYISVVWLFARVMGLGKHGAFAAGLIALSTFFFIGLSNYNRMDLLHAALLNFSFLLFYYGWKKKNGFFSLTLAFIFLALSVLINGILYVTIPFIAGFFFLLWAGKLRRITGGDGLLGFFIFLLLLFSWYGILYFYGQANYINELFKVQVLEPFGIAPYSKPLWYYGFSLVLIALPWFLLFFFVNWLQNLKSIPVYFKTRKENASTAWLIWILLTTLVLLTFTHNKQFVNLMPLMPVLAILFAKILMSLSPLKSKFFYVIFAFLLFFLGLLFLLFEFHALIFEYLPEIWILPEEIPTYIAVATTNTHFGMAVMGGIFILTAFILWKFTRKTLACGALLVSSIWLIIAVQPFSMLVAPQLDAVLSPKTQATLLAEYTLKGYIPASFQVYPNVYTYYYNEALLQKEKVENDNFIYPQKSILNLETTQDLYQFLNTNPKVILAITVEEYNSLPNKVHAKELQRQWLESKEVAITLWEVPQLIDVNETLEEQKNEDFISVDIFVPSEIENEQGKNLDMEEKNNISNPVLENGIQEEAILETENSRNQNEENINSEIDLRNIESEEASTEKIHSETIYSEQSSQVDKDIVSRQYDRIILEETQEEKEKNTQLEQNEDVTDQMSQVVPEQNTQDLTSDKEENQVGNTQEFSDQPFQETSQIIEINPEDSFLFDKDLVNNTENLQKVEIMESIEETQTPTMEQDQ